MPNVSSVFQLSPPSNIQAVKSAARCGEVVDYTEVGGLARPLLTQWP
jgi:hypothetical protein